MTSILPLWTVLAMVAPSSEQAPSPSVSLDVDVTALADPNEAATVEHGVRESQREVLEEGGIEVVEGASTTIRVTVSRWGEHDINYRFKIELFEPGSDAPTVERIADCESCFNAQLYDKITREVSRVSGRLVYAPKAEPEPEPEPDGGPGPDHTPPVGPEPEGPQPEPTVRRVGGVGWGGIAVAAAGLAATVGGAVLLAMPSGTVQAVDDDRSLDLTEYPGQAGGAVLGVGIGTFLVGGALIIVDQTVLLDRRRQRARSTSLAPLPMRSGLGLSWTGRF